MNASPQVDALAKALSEFQATVQPAIKSATNLHFGSRYATLEDVWEVIRAPLGRHGLAIYQCAEHQDGGLAVTTKVLHISGQWQEGAVWMPMTNRAKVDGKMVDLPPNAHSAGSAISYGRRYGLAAALGIVSDDDDDGNAASARPAKARPAQPHRPTDGPQSPRDWTRLPFGKEHKGQLNSDLPDDTLIDAYMWARNKKLYTEWQAEALREVDERGLRLPEA